MGAFSSEILDAARFIRRAAPAQSSLFSGVNPATYNASDPLPLWVIQVVVIVGMTQLLSLLLGRIRQPRVIAEVIGGVLLGPSVMGRIPNFTNTIFPKASIPVLTLTADIGLIFFLFLVGMEIDVRVMKRNARASIGISLAGLTIPLGLGAAVAVPIYNVFADHSVNFGYFLLFVAVSVGITAFPVLCRILTELKLLDTTVGVVVLAAGVGNDIVGWVLLALTVALVNASTGITALWVLLAAVAYVLFLTMPVRWVYKWTARRTGSLESGTPTLLMMTLTVVIVLISAFYTDIIGIHPIFGGFLAGLIIPHDNGYAIALVEKFEDLVSVLFLPLYFTLSGLNTNLGLLNNGITWGYTILICVVSFFSKFLGCAVVAKLTGFNYREAGAIGSLMSCKGLVELIALNVGLQAGILDTRTFSMFVLHALVLTFMTTPLVLLFYPVKYRVRAGALPKATTVSAEEGALGARGFSNEVMKTRFTVVLNRLEQLPAMMTLTQMLQYSSVGGTTNPTHHTSESLSDEKASVEVTHSLSGLPAMPQQSRISIGALRLIELTDRTSAVMKSQATDMLNRNDPILNVFRTFGHLNRMVMSTALSVVGSEEFSAHVADHARQASSQMVVLPWSTAPSADESSRGAADPASSTGSANPFDGLFSSQGDRTPVVGQSQFIRKVFAESPADVALFVDRGFTDVLDDRGCQHVFLPFFGGPDDRLALSFVVQLCMNPAMSATVVRMSKSASDKLTPYNTIEEAKGEQIHSTIASVHYATFPDTVYGLGDTQMRLASDTADNLLWAQYTSSATPEINGALARITFTERSSTQPLHAILEDAARAAQGPARLLVVAGRSRRLAVTSHDAELRALFAERGASLAADVRKTLGEVATAFVAANTNGSLLVLQARR
ncbi:Sodium/hydrogen exchanger family-domain-containing protein [Amylocystis lapponica]|nr:Sodium/hydrogen exchanger family-domain-containing protein [Amylocystis lapponica]